MRKVILTLTALMALLVVNFAHSQDVVRSAISNPVIYGTTFFGGKSASFPSLRTNATTLQVKLGDNSAFTTLQAANFQADAIGPLTGGKVLLSGTAPTISSGFGTSPTIPNNNGPAAFTINVGTGGVATSGVVGLPNVSNGWSCQVTDRTNNTVTRETATTTNTVTLTAASAWAASDILQLNCLAY